MQQMLIKNRNILAFSDTHGNHRELQVPENVDIVICAGDAVEDNLVGDEYDDFIEWFASLRCKWKIFVPGNHELSFESVQADRIIQRMTCQGITVLEDAVEDKGSVNILDFILKAQPKYHLFGHIHSTAGRHIQFGNTKCINITALIQ